MINKLLVSSFFFAIAFFAVSQSGISAQQSTECESVQCRQDLAAARAGTAVYHDFQVAVDNEFVPVFPCVALPSGPAMGFHYLNVARNEDGILDPARPEVLIYLPNADGEKELVAVEYLFPGLPDDTPPVLYGKQMEYNPAVSAWTLHAWIWRNNPDGIFADFNPKLRCPAA